MVVSQELLIEFPRVKVSISESWRLKLVCEDVSCCRILMFVVKFSLQINVIWLLFIKVFVFLFLHFKSFFRESELTEHHVDFRGSSLEQS